jgi:hypothetical protein
LSETKIFPFPTDIPLKEENLAFVPMPSAYPCPLPTRVETTPEEVIFLI